MKKITVFIFLVLSCLSLYAQNPREVRIFVLPVSGEGRVGDSNYFYQQLTYEVIFQHHSLIREQEGSDYILRSVISPAPERGSRNFIFFLEMVNTKTKEVIAHQNFVYYNLDNSVVTMISTIVSNMLTAIPNVFRSNNIWQNKYLYIDVKVFWAPRLYASENTSIFWTNFGLGFSLEYHFLSFMALGTGVQFTQDWILYSSSGNINESRDLILDVPFILKFVIKTDTLMIEPYGGVSLNFSVMKITEPSLLSWFGGFQFGIKAGPGMVGVDLRYSQDIYPSLFKTLEYNRHTINIGVGYKIGFVTRKSKRDY